MKIYRARTLWMAGLLTVAAGVTAQANLIHYVINDNGGLMTVWNQETVPVSIAGKFTYDTSAMVITDFNVTLTGEVIFKGTYTDGGADLSSGYRINASGTGLGDLFCLLYLDLHDFGSVGQYDITGGFVHVDQIDVDFSLFPADPQNPPYLTGTLQMGEPPTAVPEPSTWAMSLLGLAGVGAVTRIGRRKEYTK